MSILRRKSPLQDLVSLRSRSAPPERRESPPASQEWWGNLPIDLYETETDYVLTAALPGADPENIEISATGSGLIIKTEYEAEEESEGRTYYHRECHFGRTSRTIALPENVQADKVEASFDRGILTCKMPKVTQLESVKVKIN